MDKQLLVPVYLNQRLVFDLLAMLQGGLSTVRAVSQTSSKSHDVKREIGASFALSEALASLLKVDLSGKRSSSGSRAVEEEISEERVHTPASLLYQLRNSLNERGAISSLEDGCEPRSGEFIEFEASLLKNPVLEAIDGMSRIMDIAVLFDDSPKQSPKGKGGSSINENKRLKVQIDGFSESLKSGNTIDLITSKSSAGVTAVVTLEKSSLNDPMMSDLVDGRFKVLGKVIRSVSDPSDSISLIRNKELSNLPRHLRESLSDMFRGLGSEHGFSMPEVRWQIEGPAIQVLPIAIYA